MINKMKEDMFTELTKSEQKLLKQLEIMHKYRFLFYLIGIVTIIVFLPLMILGFLHKDTIVFFKAQFILFVGIALLAATIGHIRYYRLIKKLIQKLEEHYTK